MFLLFHGRYGLPIDIFDQDSILADSCKHVLFTWSPYRMNALFGGTVQKSREKELEAQEVRAFQSLVKMLSMCHLRSKGPNLMGLFRKDYEFLNYSNFTHVRFSKKESGPWITAVANAQKQLHARKRVHPAHFLLSVV